MRLPHRQGTRFALGLGAVVVLGLAVGTLSLQSPSVRGAERLAAPVLTPEQREILSHLSLVYLDDGQGGLRKTIRVTGASTICPIRSPRVIVKASAP